MHQTSRDGSQEPSIETRIAADLRADSESMLRPDVGLSGGGDVGMVGPFSSPLLSAWFRVAHARGEGFLHGLAGQARVRLPLRGRNSNWHRTVKPSPKSSKSQICCCRYVVAEEPWPSSLRGYSPGQTLSP